LGRGWEWLVRTSTNIIFVIIHSYAHINIKLRGGGRPKRNIDGQRVLIKSPCPERHFHFQHRFCWLQGQARPEPLVNHAPDILT
jgi:hypothetical protein